MYSYFVVSSCFVAFVASMQSVLRVQTLLGEQTVPALLGVHWFRLKSDILWGKVRQSQTIETKSSDYYISKVGNTGEHVTTYTAEFKHGGFFQP